MDVSPMPEARAIEIARDLVRLYGDKATGRARQRFDDASAGGNVGRADLYHAVCAVLGDRDGVFTRSRIGY